jgi:hypothetical protein
MAIVSFRVSKAAAKRRNISATLAAWRQIHELLKVESK